MNDVMKAFNKGAGSYVGTNADQQAAWDALKGYATGGASQVAGSAQNAYQYLTDPSKMLNPNNNPYLKASVEAALRPITANYTSTVLPGINNDAVMSGLFGGSRQGVAQGLASQDYMHQLADTSAGMYSSAYNTGLGAMTNALGDTSMVQAAGQLPGQILGDVGGQEQAAGQAKSNAPFSQLGQLASLLGQFLGYSGQDTTTQTPGPSALQNASSMAAVYMALKSLMSSSSDRRLKTDISKVGETKHGLNLYRFRFWGNPRYYIGVMSDEVRKVMPQAVYVDENGYDVVDYGALA
jgi:hypothetical protein